MSRFTKILYLIIALSLLITLASCGNDTPEITDAPQQTDEPQTDAPQPDIPQDTPHVHSFTEEVIPASCVAEGKITQKCSCGETGDELVIPKISHTAKEINCDKETLCGVCGTVIASATGHNMLVSEVISEATCSTEGKANVICSICGKEEVLISAQAEHTFNSDVKWSFNNGSYSATSGCVFCGKKAINEVDTPAFLLDFESPLSNVATKYDGFRIVKPESYEVNRVNANGSLGLKVISSAASIFYIDVDAEKLLELGMLSISFDMTLMNDGKSGKEPSLFSLLGNFQNGSAVGSAKYTWTFKFNNDAKKLETVQGKTLDDSNSIALEKGVKYQINILLNTQTGKAEIFVNGKYVGVSQSNYSFIKNDTQNQNLSFRLGDGSMPETIYDNIKISAVR